MFPLPYVNASFSLPNIKLDPDLAGIECPVRPVRPHLLSREASTLTAPTHPVEINLLQSWLELAHNLLLTMTLGRFLPLAEETEV